MAMHDPEVSFFSYSFFFHNLVLHNPLKIISFACTTTWKDFSTLQMITTLNEKWGIFVITGFRLQSPAGGAPCRSQQMRFVVPVNNTKIGYEPILI